MRVAMSWLNEFVDGELNAQMVADALTVAGIEVESIESLPTATPGVSESVLELAILANIARCQSMVGVAREVGALLDRSIKIDLPLAELPAVSDKYLPAIEDTSICRRFSVALINGLTVKPSPAWVQKRLQHAGIEPINNIVDAGNYVMVEMGQPLHAYDADRLSQLNLAVRRSREGDVLHTLAQTEAEPLKLPIGHPVITCDDQPVAIAGIIGGSESAIQESTTRVLLEAANFDFIAVRRAQSATKTFTEASGRFSRGVDPELTQQGLQRFVAVLQETCPQLEVASVADHFPSPVETQTVAIQCQQVEKALGVALTAQDVQALLERVGIHSTLNGDSVQAEIHSDREDITQPCDLLEEIARLYGFDRLPATMPTQPIPQVLLQQRWDARERVRDAFVLSGLQDVLSYHMTDPAIEAKLTLGATENVTLPDYVKPLNPISEQRTVLRRTLLPGLLQHAQLNLRYSQSVALFEIGTVYWPEGEGVSPLLPAECERVSGVLLGPMVSLSLHQPKPAHWDFYESKRVIEDLLARLHLSDVEWEAGECAGFHPGRCASLQRAGKVLGHVGALHPQVAEAFDLAAQNVLVFDLDLEALISAENTDYTMQALLKYPSIHLDISVVIDEQITANWLLRIVERTAGAVLQQMEVFDSYQSSELGRHKKALALRFEFNAQDRTLTMEEACETRDRIVVALEQEVGAQLRG